MTTIDLTTATMRETRQLGAVIAGGIHSAYQPIVNLDSGDVVAHEALARGPVGSALHSPAALFGAAARRGCTRELDRACFAAAVSGAVSAGLPASSSLFINVEPEVVGSTLDAEGRAMLEGVHGRFRLFLEVTERAVTLRPAELLEAVERMRRAGFGIALDDVGADRASLALLPLLRPDVVKLDMSLIHEHPSRASGEVMNGVCAYAEFTGAVILAEGVENERHLLAARSLGATLAQGFHFGRPGPLPRVPASTRTSVRLGIPQRSIHRSPFDLVSSRRSLRIGRKDVLLSVTRALEGQALDLGGHAVVAAAFQDARHFTRRSRDVYAELAASTSLTVALAAGLDVEPVPGVRGVTIAPDDPLVQEWDIAVLGPHYAGALIARDLGDSGPDMRRRFEFVLTFDRDLVVDVCASLIARMHQDLSDGAPREARQPG